MQRASISSRFSAMNLDMIIFGALWQALSMIFSKVSSEMATPGNSLILCLVASFFYFVYPTKKSGQTLGKKLLSLKVVPSEGDVLPLSWVQVVLREFIGKMISTVPLGLGYLWAYINPENKAWHDSISRTHVISLVIEEEKTTLQKIQHVMLGILSIPLGVALILGVFLYTSLPLDSIREKIEASGIQVDSLTGSLGGGLHFSQIRRQDPGQKFSLASVDVKFNLSALIYDRMFIIERLAAEEGHFEVPEGFSWATVFVNLMSVQPMGSSEEGLRLGKFKMGRLLLRNIFFENQQKVISQLQELSVKNLEMNDQELSVGEAQFQIEGLKLRAMNFKSAFGQLEVGEVIGGVEPEFLPILKVPVDFHFAGVISKNPKITQLSGGVMIDKIKFIYDKEKINLTTEQLLLKEMFNTDLPLEELDLKLSTQGENALQWMSSLSVDYALKVCGNAFKPGPEKSLVLTRADRQFNFRMIPKPVPNLSQVIFAEESSLEDLFTYELKGRKQIAPAFASRQEMIADLCYQKPLASLQAAELEVLKSLEETTEKALAPEGNVQTLLASAVPITTAAPTVAAAAEPEAFSLDKFHAAGSEARNLLRQGKYAEAKSLLESLPSSLQEVPVAELGAFYNLKAWIYLYSNLPSEAAQNFELAFNARKDIGDAEGLLRAHEALQKGPEAQKWLEYLQAALKENPALKERLTPNMQKRLVP